MKPESGSLGSDAYQHIIDELNYVLPAHLGNSIMSFDELMDIECRNMEQFYQTIEQMYKTIPNLMRRYFHRIL